ncbi:LacI family DNA-binding transcriptional regulator [Pinisolibacter aquiterrae]|uniref:LacI family DNA-binding transcriptional regulator n=1 Tax=Pinisolibacter aquiterrae TaxID=2815579 RepID=UPI001C3C6B1A|nr:LacI family DNA-binding transcriptional regulator [Pinisolibacter aquiterrae]MBV5263138.1 LacI family DNA-binding transcriptional regulator [Pinisolibacter aquiterrae]MCC8234052.1 LacI family transcriptional regulator [Pinisolibacter aquiterrae]
MSLRELAANLGLSVTTVSRALADYPDVAEETRRRVRQEAERIGYVPNATARRLQKGRADAIGVAAPNGFGAIEDAHLSAAFAGAWSRLAELDQDLLLLPATDVTYLTGAEQPTSQSFVRAVEERRVDGMVLIRPYRDDPRIAAMRRAGLPFVLLGAEMRAEPDLPAVGTDNEAAAALVCERLVHHGHRRLVCIGPAEPYDFTLSRFEHLAAAAIRHGLTARMDRAPLGEDGGREATERLLAGASGPPPPLVYLTNRMTIGGLTALARSPWVVGRHVAVIGFGDGPTLRHGLPATTVVHSPMFDMARHAVDALIALRDGRPFEVIRRWAPSLILRQSDGPPQNLSPLPS